MNFQVENQRKIVSSVKAVHALYNDRFELNEFDGVWKELFVDIVPDENNKNSILLY